MIKLDYLQENSKTKGELIDYVRVVIDFGERKWTKYLHHRKNAACTLAFYFGHSSISHRKLEIPAKIAVESELMIKLSDTMCIGMEIGTLGNDNATNQ